MKIFTYLLKIIFYATATLCSIVLPAYAQMFAAKTLVGNVQEEKSLITLKEALDAIEAKYQITISYQSELVANRKVQHQAREISSLQEELSYLLDQHNLQYKRLDERAYVITAKENKESGLLPGSGAFNRFRVLQINEEITFATISGKVSDKAGNPLPGANILIRGTTNGTTTDGDGKYSLVVLEEHAVLVFSFIGYVTQEVALNGRSVIDVVLLEDVQRLEEIVVIGYGEQRKSDLTGSVVRADIESFRESPNVNIAQSLQGSVPGLNIGQVDEAGENPTISIRGRSTINGNQNVLIVVDGIIYTGSLTDLNPNDIASVDVLKDPSSKAIFGAQAANGVILITSKEGEKSDKPVFNYSGSFTTQNPSNTMSLMNREQFIKKGYDANWTDAYLAPDYIQINPDWNYADNLEPLLRAGYENGTDYDWWDNITDPGYINEHNLSVSGTHGGLKYYMSGGYAKQKGFILNDRYERTSAKINLENKILDWFTIGTQTFASFSDYSGNSPDLSALFRTSPLVKPTDENGNYVINPDGTQVVNAFLVSAADDFDKRNSLFGNFYADVDIPFVKGLNYRLNFGNNYSWNRHYSSSPYDNGISGGAYKNNSNRYDWTLDHIVSFKRTWAEDHRFNLTLVAGQRERQYEATSATGSGYSNLRLSYHDLSLASLKDIQSDAWSESFLYQMARVNYAFRDKYLITATIRRDGFSGFAKNEKTAFFPSVGFGWVMSEEGFMDQEWLNHLKLRGSYGVNGNLVGRYSSLAELETYPAYVFGDGGSTEFGQEVQSLANANLTWETTVGFNFGVDFSILHDRINGSVDYYQTTTHDLIYDVSIPRITGFNNITSNLGEIANRGIEIDLNSTIIQKGDFAWEIHFNLASNKNKIISLIGLDADGDGQEDDLTASGLFIGESIGAIYAYESAGIIQLDEEAPEGFFEGTHRIVDQPGTNEGINPDDRVIIGRREPAYRFGILNEFNYKNFTFRFFINSVQGASNGYLERNSMPTGGSIIPSNINFSNLWNEYDYWTPANPNARYGRLDQIAATEYVYYGNRSFVRLQDVVLAYRLNKPIVEKMGIRSLKVFVSGKNLYTWTNWVGWDPETARGIAPGSRPVMQGISVGLDMSF